MYRRMTLEVPELLAERLLDAADRERRDPKQQALVIIERSLMRRRSQRGLGATASEKERTLEDA